MTAPRRDALPENGSYADRGCSASPSCLECPFARCRYDVPLKLEKPRRHAWRDAEIHRRKAAGEPVGDIAKRFGVSKRTVFRVLREVAP